MSPDHGFVVTRGTDEIASNLFPHWNRKVESETEFPARYYAVIQGSGNPSQVAFHEAYRSSEIRMANEETHSFGRLLDVNDALEVMEGATADIRPIVEGMPELAREIQECIDALESIDFEAWATVDANIQADSLEGALNRIEETEPAMGVEAREYELNPYRDSHMVRAEYKPGAGLFNVNVEDNTLYARQGERSIIEEKVTGAMEERDLLEK